MSGQWPPPRNRGESDAAYKSRVDGLRAFYTKRAQPSKSKTTTSGQFADAPKKAPAKPQSKGLGGIFDVVNNALSRN